MLSLAQISGSNFSYQHRTLAECFDDVEDPTSGRAC